MRAVVWYQRSSKRLGLSVDGITWKARWRWTEMRTASVPPIISPMVPSVYEAMVLCSVRVTSRREGREPALEGSLTASIRAPLPRSGVSHIRKSPAAASKSGGQVSVTCVSLLVAVVLTFAIRPTTTRYVRREYRAGVRPLLPVYFGPTSLVVSIGTASATASEISLIRRSWKRRVVVAALSAWRFFSMILADITTIIAMAPSTRTDTASEARISTKVNARLRRTARFGGVLGTMGIIGKSGQQ